MIYLLCVFLIYIIPVSAQNPKESEADSTGTVSIHITGFRNDGGNARIALFRGEKGFPHDGDKAYWKEIRAIANKEIKLHIDHVSYGTYAVSVFHDANKNGKLDKKWHIFPEEGFGSSNNTREEKEGPSFRESSFVVDTDSVDVEIEIEYLFGK